MFNIKFNNYIFGIMIFAALYAYGENCYNAGQKSVLDKVLDKFDFDGTNFTPK